MQATLRIGPMDNITAQADKFTHFVRIESEQGGTLIVITPTAEDAHAIAAAFLRASVPLLKRAGFADDVTRAEDLITAIVNEQNSSSADSPQR